MALVFNHLAQRIQITSPQTVVLIQDLVNACRIEEASQLGIADSRIISAAGKEVLSAGVQVGITMTLLDNWQLEFWAGNYTATITGGNLVAASGDAMAYVVGGPQVEITLSAAATITAGAGGGAGPSASAIAQAVWDELLSSHSIGGSAGEFLARFTAARAAAVDNTESRMILLEKIMRNRLVLTDGSSDNWVLYDDDGVTPLLTFDVADKAGNQIVQQAGVPSRRSRGT